MSDSVATARQCPSELGGIVCRFFGVDQVVVSPLLRRIYYIGLAAIGAWALLGMVQSVGMAIDQPGTGSLGFFLVAGFVGFATAAWRLGCELTLAVLQLFVG